jgi:hypothetical protein
VLEAVKDPEVKESARVWWVVCSEYNLGPFTKDDAHAKLAQVEAAGFCSAGHKVKARPGGLGRRL